MNKFFKKKKSVILKDQERIIGDYVLGETLGVGGYSKVKMGIHKETKKQVALKIMFGDEEGKMSESKLKQLKRELDVMKLVQHENVIKLETYYDDIEYPEQDGTKRKCVVTVLEYASGGELFDFLMFTGNFEETVTRTYFHQLINGIEAIHKQGIAHRDLKPENLLLDEDYTLKIADFGFATHFIDPENGLEIYLKTSCGTKGYLAPELIKKEKYSYQADIFAIGIILFTIYAGFPPFQNAISSDWWWDKIEKKKYKLFWMAHERSRTFSLELKDLILRLIQPDPKKRLSIHGIKQHPWYKGKTISDPKELKTYLEQRRRVVLKKRVEKIRKQQLELEQKPSSDNNEQILVRGEKFKPTLERGIKIDPDNYYSKCIQSIYHHSYLPTPYEYITKISPLEMAIRLEHIVDRLHGDIKFDPKNTATYITTSANVNTKNNDDDNNNNNNNNNHRNFTEGENITFVVKQFTLDNNKNNDDDDENDQEEQEQQQDEGQIKNQDNRRYLISFDRFKGAPYLYNEVVGKFLDSDEIVETVDADYILDQLKDVKADDNGNNKDNDNDDDNNNNNKKKNKDNYDEKENEKDLDDIEKNADGNDDDYKDFEDI